MPILWILAYVSVWTLGLFVAVGIGHNLTAQQGKRRPRRADPRFDRLMHEYQQAQTEANQGKRAR